MSPDCSVTHMHTPTKTEMEMPSLAPIGRIIRPRKFECAGRTLLVYLDSIRTAEGQIRVHVEWRPSPPPRLQPGDFESFNRCKALAEQSFALELESLRAE